MIRYTPAARRSTARDLQSVIEPLASYIAASDQPQAVLSLALEAILSEVTLLNRTASQHVATRIQESGKKGPEPVDFVLARSTRL